MAVATLPRSPTPTTSPISTKPPAPCGWDLRRGQHGERITAAALTAWLAALHCKPGGLTEWQEMAEDLGGGGGGDNGGVLMMPHYCDALTAAVPVAVVISPGRYPGRPNLGWPVGRAVSCISPSITCYHCRSRTVPNLE